MEFRLALSTHIMAFSLVSTKGLDHPNNYKNNIKYTCNIHITHYFKILVYRSRRAVEGYGSPQDTGGTMSLENGLCGLPQHDGGPL